MHTPVTSDDIDTVATASLQTHWCPRRPCTCYYSCCSACSSHSTEPPAQPSREHGKGRRGHQERGCTGSRVHDRCRGLHRQRHRSRPWQYPSSWILFDDALGASVESRDRQCPAQPQRHRPRSHLQHRQHAYFIQHDPNYT